MHTLAFLKLLLTAGTVVASLAVSLICVVGLLVWVSGGPVRPSK